jgi:myo-inositol-1-phosphate synthase
MGTCAGEEVYVPLKDLIPMVNPNELVLGGWDVSSMNLGDAMKRAGVFEYDLQKQLYPHLQKLKPMPSVYVKDFIAANQEDRADNVLTGSIQ